MQRSLPGERGSGRFELSGEETAAQIKNLSDLSAYSGYREAATALTERVGAVVSGSGMSPQTQAHFRETFLAPLQAGITLEAPLLVALTPPAG
ncbi:hypothetical protein ACFRMN_23005 [Streptomyces sp. NPDC056835]|uniref:hypothetical protein n=1 Tax=Streptomyces sp. NPDC056835 TaxID=3345956 RepID=UPI0036C563B1